MTIGDKIAAIASFFLPRRVKYYAMLDWLDWMPTDAMHVDCPRYHARIEKVVK